MTLNANAKAFVPGGGGSAGSAPSVVGAVVSPSVPLPPTEPPLFRYNIMLNPSHSVDTETTPSFIPTLSFLLSRRSLVGVAKGGPGSQAARMFYEEFFSTLTLPLPETPTTPLSANGLYVPSNTGAGTQSNVGFFLSRDQLHHASEILVEANDRDGFLIPLADVPSQATHMVVAPLVAVVWESLFRMLFMDTRVSGMGYLLVEGPKSPETQTATYHHYFFVAAAKPTNNGAAPLTAELFEQISKYGAVRVMHLLPYVLANNTPLGAILRFTSSPMVVIPEEGTEAQMGVFHVEFHPSSATRSIASTLALQSRVHQYLDTFPRKGTTKRLTDIVEVFVHVAASSKGSGNEVTSLSMSTAGFIQSLETLFRFVMGSVVGCIAPNETEEEDSVLSALHLENVVDAPWLTLTDGDNSASDEGEECAALQTAVRQCNGKQFQTILSEDSLSRSMLPPLQGIAMHVPSVAEYQTVLQELQEAFTAPTAEDGKKLPVPLSATEATPFSLSHCLANREVTAKNLLTRAVFTQNVNKLVKEPLRVRRRLVGTPVMLVVDNTCRISLINLFTHEIIAMIHGDIWSCLQWQLYPLSASSNVHNGGAPANCVAEATLVSTYRGDRQFRVIIHDVLRWNGVNVAQRPFLQRFSLLDPLEEENNWSHSSSHNVVILRSQYVTLAQTENSLLTPGTMHAGSSAASSLLAAPASAAAVSQCDHPYLGFEVITTGPHTLHRFVWMPQDALSVRFQAGIVETVDPSVRRAHLLARKDLQPIAATPTGKQAPPKPAGNDDEGEDNEVEDVEEEEFDPVDFYNSQFVDFYASEAEIDVQPGCVLNCTLRRIAQTQEHYWELLTAAPAPEAENILLPTQELTLVSLIDAMVASPMITADEWRWLHTAANNLCTKCGNVDDRGKSTGGPRTFLCRSCWELDGYGDCLYCSKSYVHGGKDTFTDRFYCEACWAMFQASRNFPAGAPPPPPDATFMCQVSTRVFSLMIDSVCGGKGVSNDILELCAGGSVVRKWASAQAQRYLAVEKSRALVDELKASIVTHKPTGSQFEAVCADAFDTKTWLSVIPLAHPQQFHVVTCFHGLHHCFDSESHARDVLFRISNALVPNGVFLAGAIGANALFQRGREVTTSVFTSSWGSDSGPRLGASYRLTVAGDAEKTKNVVPLDVLVAIASDYDLILVEEQCTTFQDVLLKDAKWLRPTTQEEKDFLGICLTVVFRKAANREATATSPSSS